MFPLDTRAQTVTDVILGLADVIHEHLPVGEIGERYMDAAPGLVRANGYGLYFVNHRTGRPRRVALRAAVDRFVSRYETDAYTCDPLLPHMLRTRTPVHEGMLFTKTEWQGHPLSQALGMRHMVHVLGAPLAAGNRIFGILYFTRAADEPGFSSAEVGTVAHAARHVQIAMRNALELAEARRRLDETQRRLAASTRTFSATEHRRAGGDSANGSAAYSTPGRPEANARGTSPLTVEHLDATLSRRERDVLVLVAQGVRNGDIARRLFISPNTVKFHIKRIHRALGVGSRAELLARLYAGDATGSAGYIPS